MADRNHGYMLPAGKKYVFLEPDIDAHLWHRFYGIGFLITVGIILTLGKDAASIAVLLLVGVSPYGISGEKISLCARIMAVADVFDALTSKRVYKSAMPLEKAYAIIREESGTHFDPEVV